MIINFINLHKINKLFYYLLYWKHSNSSTTGGQPKKHQCDVADDKSGCLCVVYVQVCSYLWFAFRIY